MFWRLLRNILIIVIILFLGNATLPSGDPGNLVRAYTRPIEFDYLSWTLDAIEIKIDQAAWGEKGYQEDNSGPETVRDYISLISSIQESERNLELLHSNPNADALTFEISSQEQELEALKERREESSSLVEAILQEQMAAIAAESGLATIGLTFPPVLFHSTPLPWALIVSPRDGIQQDANISLKTDLDLIEHIELEDEVSAALNVSTLVVPVGGIGSYPTMIAQSSNLKWLTEVIAHEWIHNYLTLRPLGLLYNRNQDLRTMNETVASIAGKELGGKVIERYYPELHPQPPPIESEIEHTQEIIEDSNRFDFRAEMHATRIEVDKLLEEGAIEEAEKYMEERRLLFWDHGYPIRKLNQAYFAFYGSYADQEAGPAGEDPVGNAVRQLRAQSPSLESFIKKMAFITSTEELLKIDLLFE